MVALAGSLIIIGKPWENGMTDVTGLTGNLLIVVAVFCGVVSTLISKPLSKKGSAYQITFMNLFPGVIPIALYAVSQLPNWDIHSTTTRSFHALLLSIVAVVLANFLFFYALRYVKAQDTGVYQYLDPAATVLAA